MTIVVSYNINEDMERFDLKNVLITVIRWTVTVNKFNNKKLRENLSMI